MLKTLYQKVLKSERFAAVVAKTAVIFQSAVTCIVVTLLLISLKWGNPLYIYLQCILYLDIMFVILHLLYRSIYSGPKILLQHKEKGLLIAHAGSSLAALMFTFFIVENLSRLSFFVITLAISIWVFSLATGIMFYFKKYHT